MSPVSGASCRILGIRFVGKDEEIIENLLRELVIVEQRPLVIGNDEFICLLTVADGEGIVFVVLDETDDLEFQLFSIGRFDNEDIAKFEQTVVLGSIAVARAIRRIDDRVSLPAALPPERFVSRFRTARQKRCC